MMARTCDCCGRLIQQTDDKYVELQVRVLDATEGDSQDTKEQDFGDFCDRCIANGKALAQLLQQVGWKLEPKET